MLTRSESLTRSDWHQPESHAFSSSNPFIRQEQAKEVDSLRAQLQQLKVRMKTVSAVGACPVLYQSRIPCSVLRPAYQPPNSRDMQNTPTQAGAGVKVESSTPLRRKPRVGRGRGSPSHDPTR